MTTKQLMERSNIQATSLVAFIQNPNKAQYHLNYIRNLILKSHLEGLNLAIEKYLEYVSSKTPIMDELIAMRQELEESINGRENKM